jgi:hypothetical protein
VCKTDADCGQGLNCFQCAAANATAPPICTRSLATPVSSFVKVCILHAVNGNYAAFRNQG